MTDSAVLAKICSIPRDFRGGALSPIQLVARSGYRDIHSTLTVSEIVEHLRANPTLIDDWFVWSQNKRTSEGWYLSLQSAGGSVGYVGSTNPELAFGSRAEACAQFIVLELASIDSHEPDRDRTT